MRANESDCCLGGFRGFIGFIGFIGLGMETWDYYFVSLESQTNSGRSIAILQNDCSSCWLILVVKSGQSNTGAHKLNEAQRFFFSQNFLSQESSKSELARGYEESLCVQLKIAIKRE